MECRVRVSKHQNPSTFTLPLFQKMRLPFLSDDCSCKPTKKKSKTLQQLQEEIEIQRAKLKLVVEQKETELHLDKLKGKQAVTSVANAANVEIKKYDSLHDIEAAKNDVKEELRQEGKTGWDKFLDSPVIQTWVQSFTDKVNTRVNNSVNNQNQTVQKGKNEVVLKETKANYFG